MQTAFKNICERLFNKSICEISLLINIPRSSVSGIKTKWKQMGTIATKPQSGRPRKMTERESSHAEVTNVCRVNS
ncbi:unnamed protein product [Staurois parvus]|uniref:Uncharacterized protein n=1 Tax=Staurois parvus TaxID=386267 RepID=A0ABN9GM45_9NEOB|nr:unnamed protein product [Staurois parvus]